MDTENSLNELDSQSRLIYQQKNSQSFRDINNFSSTVMLTPNSKYALIVIVVIDVVVIVIVVVVIVVIVIIAIVFVDIVIVLIVMAIMSYVGRSISQHSCLILPVVYYNLRQLRICVKFN